MDKEDCVIIGLIVGVLITLMLLSFLVIFPYQTDVKKLGGAICEKEYGVDFDEYSGGKLYCKAEQTELNYDGLPVVINNEGNKDEIR